MLTRDKLPTSLPFFLGAKRTEVHANLGTPDRTVVILGHDVENYVELGLTLQYDEHDTLFKISACWLSVAEKEGVNSCLISCLQQLD